MLEIVSLCSQLQKIAIDELGEVPARIPEDLQALKDWIKKQSHLRARTDDKFLLQFLRGCKYSLEKSKEKLDHFYALKSKYPELFGQTDVCDPEFRKFHNVGSYVVLPTPLNDCGPRIIFCRYTYGPQDFSIELVLRHGVAANEALLMTDPYACIHGTFYVFDFEKATMQHLLLVTPSITKKLISFYEKTLPLRIKGICFINLSPYAEQVIKTLLHYAPEKMKNRIFICGKNMDILSKQIPKKYFPKDYGGENGVLDEVCADFNKVWDEQREYFKQNEQYGTNESVRRGKCLDLGDDLGGCGGGSFRKIVVD